MDVHRAPSKIYKTPAARTLPRWDTRWGTHGARRVRGVGEAVGCAVGILHRNLFQGSPDRPSDSPTLPQERTTVRPELRWRRPPAARCGPRQDGYHRQEQGRAAHSSVGGHCARLIYAAS